MGEIKQLLIIGYGNMSGAMLAGWLASGIAPDRFAVLNRSPKSAPEGVRVFRDIAEAQADYSVAEGLRERNVVDVYDGRQAAFLADLLDETHYLARCLGI